MRLPQTPCHVQVERVDQNQLTRTASQPEACAILAADRIRLILSAFVEAIGWQPAEVITPGTTQERPSPLAALTSLDRLNLRPLAVLLATLSIGLACPLQAATVLSNCDGDTNRVLQGQKSPADSAGSGPTRDTPSPAVHLGLLKGIGRSSDGCG